MAASIWKGSIVLSLVSIPVALYPAARSERTYLHQIHKECNSRVRQQLFCPTCNRTVRRDEIVKGYEFDEGQYVLMEDEEIKKLAAVSSTTLELLAFTRLKEIDPIFFDSSYFVLAEDSGRRAYQLLVKALEETQSVGIGKLLMHQRDYTVFLRAYEHGLLLHTMYFANEIRRLPQFGVFESVSLKPAEVNLTKQLVESLTEPFHPLNYHDEFQERLTHLIKAKQQGKSIEIPREKRSTPVIDMMTALKKSLAARPAPLGEKRNPAKSLHRKLPARKAS